jgi:hypothetical protein
MSKATLSIKSWCKAHQVTNDLTGRQYDVSTSLARHQIYILIMQHPYSIVVWLALERANSIDALEAHSSSSRHGASNTYTSSWISMNSASTLDMSLHWLLALFLQQFRLRHQKFKTTESGWLVALILADNSDCSRAILPSAVGDGSWRPACRGGSPCQARWSSSGPPRGAS